MLSRRPLEDTTQDKELLEKCLELFEVMEGRCHTASILLYVRAPPRRTGAYSPTSSIIGGFIREPSFDLPGPYAKRGEGGKGWVVSSSKPTQRPAPTSFGDGEFSRTSGACVVESETGLSYYVGLDMSFSQVFEPRVTEEVEHSGYFTPYQQPTYNVGQQ